MSSFDRCGWYQDLLIQNKYKGDDVGIDSEKF